MATTIVAGKVSCKEGSPAVTFRESPTKDGSTFMSASFSVRDEQYAYFKNKEDNPGQFYRCEVTGKLAQVASDRLKRGDRVSVTGQAVWHTYNDNKHLTLKNCAITFLEPTGDAPSSIDTSSIF